MNYTDEVREAVLGRALSREGSQRAIAQEFGVSLSTVQNWLHRYRSGAEETMGNSTEKRAEEWSAQERLEALVETGSLSGEELGAWCRSRGVHTHQLKQWREELLRGSSSKAAEKEARALREENRALKKELRRKDKALAETAAVLVLKKKATLLWGEREDD